MLSFSKLFSQIIRLRVKSAVDSLFKYGAIFFLLAVIQSFFPHVVPAWALIASYSISGILILTGICAYIYFARTAPNFLRSEEYQLKRESQFLIGDKHNPSLDGRTDLAPTTNTLIGKTASEQKD